MAASHDLRHEKSPDYPFCARCGERWPCSFMEQDAEIERLTLLADARAVTLAQYREALVAIEALSADAIFDAFNGRTLDVQLAAGRIREEALALLAQPDPDQRGSELMAAADALAVLLTRVSELECVGPEAADWVLDTYRRLRGATTSASAEPHKNGADF